MPLPVPTPPSTNSSIGASPDNAQFRVVRKRNRIPLSCAPCRSRKLKCNRGHPCDNCTKRGDTPNCTYAASNARRKAANGPNGTPDDMQNRIDRLENLVLSLMSTGQTGGAAAARVALDNARKASTSAGSQGASTSLDQDNETEMQEDEHEDDSDVNDLSQGVGVMKVDGHKSVFISDAHWYAILSNIAEVKNFYQTHKEDMMAHWKRVEATHDDDVSGATFLLKAPRLNSREEVMSNFPIKQQTDMLIGRYFNSYDPSVNIIHGPTFQKQYDAHWADPSETSLSFIALMYAMMSLALQSYDRAGDEPPEYFNRSQKLSVAYRRLTAQTLVFADIKEPVPQILEALVLHAHAEFSRTRDTDSGVIVLIPLMVRLAMRMGYHRDPAPHPNIPPFQAEMRRRVWSMIRLSDLLFSFQSGLPPVSRHDDIDTDLPRNIYDDELTEDMTELPMSRPDTEPTPMSYMIAKARMASVFGKITERFSSIHSPPSYEEVMDIDKVLRDVRATFPPHLRPRPLHESANDAASLIMQRYGLELLYLKSQCVLHRRFLNRGRESPRFAYSRRTCIDASMDMLTHQATLHHESQPGGRLHSVKWYISSLTANDFLLAAMIVCLELHHVSEADRLNRKGSAASSPMSQDLIEERREEMLGALRHSMNIWDSLRDRSMEAWKASSTLRVMLEKLMSQRSSRLPTNQPQGFNDWDPMMSRSRGPLPSGVFQTAVPPFSAMTPAVGNPADSGREQEQAAAMTLGLLSSGGVSPNGQQQQHAGGSSSGSGLTPGSAGDARGYPSSMAGLLNEPAPGGQQQQSQNGFLGAQEGAANAPSPFSQFMGFGAQSMFDNMPMGGGTEIDWGAWDNFVQGATMDPVNMWPSLANDGFGPNGNGAIDPAIEGGGGNGPGAEGQSPQQGKAGGGGTFMGASTPSAAGLM